MDSEGQTQADAHGAALLNYAPVEALTHDREGLVDGLRFRDLETGEEHRLAARCVINAAGPFCDIVRRLDDPDAAPLLAPSQGVHLVLDRAFLPGDAAIMVPHTRDGRVMFAIPWHGHTLLGTTDTPVKRVSLEPKAGQDEIDLILDTAGPYLAKRPGRSDILSVFAGIRPLVRGGADAPTSNLSREHVIHIERSALLTVAGGKWTTYRKMAEDCVGHAATIARLEARPCVTRTLKIHGYHENTAQFGDLSLYGSAAPSIRALIQARSQLGARLHPHLPICPAQVVWAVTEEMARTVDDVLARRTRALMLDARAALEMAPAVAQIMAHELSRDQAWQDEQVAQFTALAAGYLGQT